MDKKTFVVAVYVALFGAIAVLAFIMFAPGSGDSIASALSQFSRQGASQVDINDTSRIECEDGNPQLARIYLNRGSGSRGSDFIMLAIDPSTELFAGTRKEFNTNGGAQNVIVELGEDWVDVAPIVIVAVDLSRSNRSGVVEFTEICGD